MKRRIHLGIGFALVGVTVLLVAGAPAPAQPPSKENHFRCYIVSQQTPQPAQTITLDEEEHYTLYPAPGVASPRTALVTDQFGNEVPWQVTTPKYLLVPTAKTIGGVTFDDRADLNHYWCYQATGPRVGVRATLEDQFSGPDDIRVAYDEARAKCDPALVSHLGYEVREHFEAKLQAIERAFQMLTG